MAMNLTVKFHYKRSDSAEREWNVWIWADIIGGAAYGFEVEDDEYVATFVVENKDIPFLKSLNYIIRQGEWLAQEDTRCVDISDIVGGTVHIRIDENGSVTRDTLDAVKGTKINDVRYDRKINKIVVMTSSSVDDYDNAFALKDVYGSDITITEVAASGETYTITIEEDLSSLSKVCGAYRLTYGGIDYTVTMPNIYRTEEFEEAYTYGGSDLGATWSKESTTFRVWAPTANNVKVQLYKAGSDAEDSEKLGTYPMTKDINGTWITTVDGDMNGVYYTYLTDVAGNVRESCDPYAKTTGVNGERAMVLDMHSTDPECWMDDVSPFKGKKYTDAVIYELHVRDLSINEESGVRDEWKGKFLGLSEEGTTNKKGIPTGLDHIKDLGVTHVHLLPSYDYASIDETMTEEEKANDTSKQFNWGYDPVNYNVPEGSYATNPYDGAVRVREMKLMIHALHKNNIGVVLDVVYNHVYDAGVFCFNKIVPDYFSRTNADGSYSNGSGCGNDTASERAMVRKYIVDSVKYWADEYHMDGFRFDLVGLLDAETINSIVKEVHKTHPEVIFYGEGWTMDTAVEPADTIMATQLNAKYTENFAYFSDTFRDFLKGKIDEVSIGYVQNVSTDDTEDMLIDCFMANTPWIVNPTQVINYASCHDNYALMDKINATKSTVDMATRIKMNNLAAAIYLTAEGIPLIHAGEELLRTKVNIDGKIIENSYNSPDYINSLKWGDLCNADYQNVRDYYKGLIEFRKAHAALRMSSKADVNAYVTPVKLGNNVVLFDIAGCDKYSEEVSEGIVVIFNPNETEMTYNLYDIGISEGTWNICINDVTSGTKAIDTVTDGVVVVPSVSALVLVKGKLS